MRLRFIVNPCSGRHRRSARLQPMLRQFIAARGLDADVLLTDGPGHATALALEGVRAGCQRIVAVGGDGTMNEVAQALLDCPAALALIPCGFAMAVPPGYEAHRAAGIAAAGPGAFGR